MPSMVIGSDKGSVLLVDDDAATSRVIADALTSAGYVVEMVESGAAAHEYLERRTPDLILLDLGLPDADGLDLLVQFRELGEFFSVVILSGQMDIETVVEAMRRGADNFLSKPASIESILDVVDSTLADHQALKHAWVYAQAVSVQGSASVDTVLGALVGESLIMQRVRELTASVALTEASVILSGEAGTGKGTVARAIHRLSSRASGPFVVLDCGGTGESSAEAELFGHERGTIARAAFRRPGLLEVAGGGTVYLDGIAGLSLECQAKLLRAIEEGYITRLGGTRRVEISVRFIVGAHRDLESEAKEGRVLSDLLFRLNVFQIHLPPLRDRIEDVGGLASHFLRTLNSALDRDVERISAGANRVLIDYSWPGNVRELRNVVERAMILAGGKKEILPRHLPSTLTPSEGTELRSLHEVEEEHIQRVLTACKWNILQASKILGISRSTLYAKMKRLGLEDAPPQGD